MPEIKCASNSRFHQKLVLPVLRNPVFDRNWDLKQVFELGLERNRTFGANQLYPGVERCENFGPHLFRSTRIERRWVVDVSDQPDTAIDRGYGVRGVVL